MDFSGFICFFTNRIWVFDGKTNGAKEFFVQMINFFGGRVATLVVEEVILFVFITKLGFGSMVVKIAAQIIVIVLNYVISKLWVSGNKKLYRAGG